MERNNLKDSVGLVYIVLVVILMFPVFFGAFCSIMLIEHLEKDRHMKINNDLQIAITWLGAIAGCFLFYWITGLQPTSMGDDY